MKKCEKCGFVTENNEMNFCVKCGSKMTEISDVKAENAPVRYCGKCGAANKAEANFCVKCGNALAAKKISLSKASDTAVSAAAFDSVSQERSAAIDPDSNADNNASIASVGSAPKNKRIGVIAACVGAVAIAVGGVGFAVSQNKSDFPTEENTETVTAAAEETQTAEQTEKSTVTASVTAETSAETTSAVTSAAEITIVQQLDGEIMPVGDDTLTYSFNGGSLSFDSDNRFFKSHSDYDDDNYYYFSYYSCEPTVKINGNNAAAKKIQETLKTALRFDHYGEAYGADEIGYKPDYRMGDMEFTNSIKCVTVENDLLFVTVGYLSDWGGGVSSSIYYMEHTYIFDTATGDDYALTDFITNKSGFKTAVNDYMSDIVYNNTYISTDDETYKLSEGISFEEFDNDLRKDPWLNYNEDWNYNGKELNITYGYLLGSGYINKATSFTIPKSVWEDNVDFSSDAKADYADTDALGKKVMSGNTAGNYCNYSAYSFDPNTGMMYYAGGEDGYHWKLCSAHVGSSSEYATVITEDMTDSVLIFNNTVYYRNANDNYKLYSISTDGRNRKKVTDYRVSAFRLYDGSIYLSADNALYRIERDGSGKTKLLDKACYDLQIYDDRIYTVSSDSKQIEYYDMQGNYQGAFTPSYSPIKEFYVSYGQCVVASENAFSFIDVDTGEELYYYNSDNSINCVGINENKDNFIMALDDGYDTDYIYFIPKNDLDNYYYVDSIDLHNREFYITYNSNNTYIITLDENGTAYCTSLDS